ncbi:MAG: hypothetical protein GEV04_25265, partial [Actinophytocola sp.]|nr:hypothetical protein [Actinophytocola sp.]
ADRAYNPDGTLVSRRQPGAVLDDSDEVARRCVRMATEGEIVAVDGTVIPVDADSICVHGDSPGAVDMAKAVRAALDSGDIDMYWEYTGTGWSVILQREISEAPADTQELYQAVADADLEESQVVWLDAAEANNTYALATLSSRAEELGVTTISEFAELASSNPEAATLCGATEWLTRDDGYPGLA